MTRREMCRGDRGKHVSCVQRDEKGRSCTGVIEMWEGDIARACPVCGAWMRLMEEEEEARRRGSTGNR